MLYTYFMPSICQDGQMSLVMLRLTPAEKKRYETEAKKKQMTVTAVIRERLGLKQLPMGRPPKKKE